MSASRDQQIRRSVQGLSVNESPPHAARREILQPALLLLLLLAVFFWPSVFGGRVLLPADLIFDVDPLWQPLAPEGYTHPANHVLADQVYQFLPWKILTVNSLAQGYLPLWNPHTNAGQPLVGNALSGVFSPFNLLGYLLSLYSSLVAGAIFRLFVAGTFTFLFAREIGLSKPGALLAMLSFTFSGPMTVWVGFPPSFVIAWLPAMLWSIERALTRRSGLYVVVSGLTVGAQFLGGQPEVSFHVMLAWAAYALYRAIARDGWRPSRLLPQLLRIATAAAVGGLLAAVQLLPFVETVLQSTLMSARHTELAQRSSSFLVRLLLEWHNWPTAVTLILPRYFGTPLDKSYLYPYSNAVEQNAYVGVLPLALAAAVALQSVRRRSSPRRNLTLFFALLGGVCLGVAIRLPLLNIINYLPLFSISRNGRMRLIYAFAVAVLAGLGLDESSRGRRDCRRNTLRILGLLALISLALVVLAYVGFTVFKDEIIRLGRAFAEAQWGTPHYSRPLAYYYTQVEEKCEKRLASFLPTNVVMYLPVLVTLACLALRRWGQKLRLHTNVWTYAALGLTILDLLFVGIPFNSTAAPEHVFPVPDAIRFLQRDPGVYRVSGTGLILYPNSGMLSGISDIRGYDPVAPLRPANLMDRIEGHVRSRHHSLFTEVDAPLLDLLNVKYVLTDQELDGRWELAYTGTGGIHVYRNRSVLPRAFVVYRAEVVDSAAGSLQRTTDGAFDFRESVVLEEAPEDWTEPPEVPSTPAVVRIVDYEPNRVSVAVETAVDGLLVLTDTYMPGWKALLDGQATRLYVADHAFRAVIVPAGAHQVEFVYRPLAFEVGWSVSLLTLAGVAAAVVGLLRRRGER